MDDQNRGTARRVLVVGNSDGVGLAFTRQLLDDGFTVTGASRSASRLTHDAYEHSILDVSSPAYRAELSTLHARRGPFDICVYCAGIGDLLDPALPDHLAREADVVRVNLVGAIETAAVVIPSMVLARRGHFVALSSIGDGISPEAPSYAASKAGLSSWLGGLALALRPHGVAVTNVRLGFVDTKMAKSKVKPFIISADRAARVLRDCLASRPARRTFPRIMQVLVTFLGLWTTLRLWLS